MKKKLSPLRHAAISCGIMMIGVLIAIIGGIAAPKENRNLFVEIGVIVVLGGIVWRVVKVKCPHCGQPLSGWKLLPKACPKCGGKWD